jgi:hypothetical protein
MSAFGLDAAAANYGRLRRPPRNASSAFGRCGRPMVHDPEKACPGLDPGGSRFPAETKAGA